MSRALEAIKMEMVSCPPAIAQRRADAFLEMYLSSFWPRLRSQKPWFDGQRNKLKGG